MFKSLSFLLLLQAASAMQIQVQNMTCLEDLSITVDFDRLCTNESICTVGKSANLEGILTFNHLTEEYDMNEYSNVYVDLNVSLFTRDAAAKDYAVHKPAYEGKFFDFARVPVCANNTITALSEDATCPSSGEYQFSTGLKLPHPDNIFQTWMHTGYDGFVKLGIYRSEQYDSDVLGACTFYITTEQESSRLGNLPNGKPVHEAIISFLAVFLWCVAIAFCCLLRKQRSSKQAESEQLQKVVRHSPEDKVDGRFKRMEEQTKEEEENNFAFRYVETDAMRYIPPEDDPTPPSTFERVMCIA